MKVDIDAIRPVFKKYDIRGEYPVLINEDLVVLVSKALAEKEFKKGKVVVGMDARKSSPSLYEAACTTLEGFGDIEVERVGLITTPMLAFLVNHLDAVGGMMITASHNPKDDNGIKVAKRGGGPMGGEEILELVK